MEFPIDDGARWRAVLERDRRADDAFVYAVATTGIYCRPTCASRRPRREHVTFHATPAAAESSGFRSCLRCTPAGISPRASLARAIERACRAIDDAETAPSLGELARASAMSAFHFHRAFRAFVGLTPREYAAARRRARLHDALASATTVTDAAFDAGYGSSRQFYATAGDLGMPPAQRKRGGRDATICVTTVAARLGTIAVATTASGICAVELASDAAAALARIERRFPHAGRIAPDAAFGSRVARAVARVEEGHPADDALPAEIRDFAFAQCVWDALDREKRTPASEENVRTAV